MAMGCPVWNRWSELAAFEHLRHVVPRSQLDEPRGAPALEPLAIRSRSVSGGIEQLEHLGRVGIGVARNLVASERRARLDGLWGRRSAR